MFLATWILPSQFRELLSLVTISGNLILPHNAQHNKLFSSVHNFQPLTFCIFVKTNILWRTAKTAVATPLWTTAETWLTELYKTLSGWSWFTHVLALSSVKENLSCMGSFQLLRCSQDDFLPSQCSVLRFFLMIVVSFKTTPSLTPGCASSIGNQAVLLFKLFAPNSYEILLTLPNQTHIIMLWCIEMSAKSFYLMVLNSGSQKVSGPGHNAGKI